MKALIDVKQSGNGNRSRVSICETNNRVDGGRIWIESEKDKECTVCFAANH